MPLLIRPQASHLHAHGIPLKVFWLKTCLQ
jgi:hypothetical protein